YRESFKYITIMRLPILLLALSVSATMLAQKNVNIPQHLNVAVPANKALTGFDSDLIQKDRTAPHKPITGPSVLQKNNDLSETILGATTYDLQSNGSVQNRLIYDGTTRAAAWTFSELTPPASPDRGTGYGWDDGAGWSVNEESLESIRTGWPSLLKTAGGREVITNHNSTGSFNFIYRDAGTEAWTEEFIPSALGDEGWLLWGRAVAGGSDGNSIHLIGITAPVANGGTIQLEQDGAFLYWRSQDQGETWDIQDFQIEGVGSDFFTSFTGDAYTIISDGDEIAIACFGDFADTFVLRSSDNGDTWTKTVIYDFPVDLYDESEIIDLDEDGFADTLESSDGAGALLFDSNGQLHAVFGNMRYLDEDLGDGTFSYFPATSGMYYWNESMGANSAGITFDLYDVDGDGFVFGPATNFPAYQFSLNGMPSMAKDDNGNIYLVYSAMVDNVFEDGTGVNYRHIYVTSSPDGGETWMGPYDVSPEDPEEETDQIECVYPYVYPEVIDGSLAILYHRDYGTGLVVRSDETIDSDNSVIYLEVTVDEVLGIEESQVDSPFTLFPNPNSTGNMTIVGVDGNYQFYVTDILGKRVSEGRVQSGQNTLDINGLSEGIYQMIFIDGERFFVEKFMVN
ncbi:MAG: T9SS type A sorting domain-containing protein, partial [Bacteroidetes bacterium]|nr:T9SS type A sorting domain-containing protein [Bacteroidota bacterium]